VAHGAGGESIPSLATDGAVALRPATCFQELPDFLWYFVDVPRVSPVTEALAVAGCIRRWGAIGSSAIVRARRAGARATNQEEKRENGRGAGHGSMYHATDRVAMNELRS
jgi:hypothetical protein